mmetsp:Transcript_84713/g.237131  ORF Transcript_84713/g.237131 Transcript_84713/m.237131 type:complete len:251 (-) Transcript_84713:923-1675(-)
MPAMARAPEHQGSARVLPSEASLGSGGLETLLQEGARCVTSQPFTRPVESLKHEVTCKKKLKRKNVAKPKGLDTTATKKTCSTPWSPRRGMSNMASRVANAHGPKPIKKQACPKSVMSRPQCASSSGRNVVTGKPTYTAPTVNAVIAQRMRKVQIKPQRARHLKRPLSVKAPACFNEVSSQPMVQRNRCFHIEAQFMGANSPERDSAQNSMRLPSKSCWIAMSTSSVCAVSLNSRDASTDVFHKALEPEK